MTLDELIMTRVSHDLAGIIGALYNTAELLEIDPAFATESGSIIKTSTGTLMARLKFFRAIFGTDGAPLNTQIVQEYLNTLSAAFTLNGTIDTRRQAVAVLICADTMIRGGKIDLTNHSVTGIGQIKIDEAFHLALSGTLDSIPPKLAPVAWLVNHNKIHHLSISADIDTDCITLCF